MKTIEEAAISLEYNVGVLMSNPEEIAKISFVCGFQFAQQWILIEEEFPDFGTWIIAKRNNTYAAAKIYGEVDVKFIKMNFTHWRPIELK
jgi:hypothetical protein